MKRPSVHELGNKLKEALAAASMQRILLVEPVAIVTDLLDLDFLVQELPAALVEILPEIGPKHYAGGRPPARSYENVIAGCDLFAFKWLSQKFGCHMYFKFTLKDGVLYIVSLHQDRAKRG
jgi:hypothetical protein